MINVIVLCTYNVLLPGFSLDHYSLARLQNPTIKLIPMRFSHSQKILITFFFSECTQVSCKN